MNDRRRPTIVIATREGVTDAHQRDEREYRAVPMTIVEVSRGGSVRVDGAYPDINRFPYLDVESGSLRQTIHVPAAVAKAFLSEKNMRCIREHVPPDAQPDDKIVRDVVAHLNIWDKSVLHVAKTPAEKLHAMEGGDIANSSLMSQRAVHALGVTVENYRWVLADSKDMVEKVGRPNCLFRHFFEVAGEKFLMMAYGKTKFARKNDRASFEYFINSHGERIVNAQTFFCLDKYGAKVVRGDRREVPHIDPGYKKRRSRTP